MNKLLGGLHGQTRRHMRRLWLQYGILWSGAVVTGLVAVLYAWLIDYGFELFHGLQQRAAWLPLLLTPATGAACVWFTRRYFPGSEGSGIPQVIAALGDKTPRRSPLAEKLLTVKIVCGKIALSFVAILGGFTIGREGPTVQVGAAIMYNLRHLYPRHANVILEKRLMLAGAAAGLSAAFNTPLAGIVFAIEELSRSFEQRASGVVITTIIFAGVVALGLNGNYVYFGSITAVADSARSMIAAVVVCGVLMGVAGGIFGWMMLNVPRWLPAPLRTMRAERPVLFGALCGLAVAVVGVLAGGATFGSGYLEARASLSGAEQMSAAYPLAKMASLIGSYLPGIPGGIFAPSLSIGAGFGNLLHMMFGNISLPVLISLAMVGYLAAVTQAPITAFVIVMEMINGHSLVISLMATSLLASRVSRFFVPPLYEALSERYSHAHTSPAPSVPPTPAAATPAPTAVPPAPADVPETRDEHGPNSAKAMMTVATPAIAVPVAMPPMVDAIEVPSVPPTPEVTPDVDVVPDPAASPTVRRATARRTAKPETKPRRPRKVAVEPSEAPADNRTLNLLEGLEPPQPVALPAKPKSRSGHVRAKWRQDDMFGEQ